MHSVILPSLSLSVVKIRFLPLFTDCFTPPDALKNTREIIKTELIFTYIIFYRLTV